MKNLLLHNWNAWRIVRLGAGLFFTVAGFVDADWMLTAGGVFLIIHALLNLCVTCAGGSCRINYKHPIRQNR